MRATPWDLHRPREPEVIFKDRPDEKKEHNYDGRVAVARQMYIKPKDLEEHGLTQVWAREGRETFFSIVHGADHGQFGQDDSWASSHIRRHR